MMTRSSVHLSRCATRKTKEPLQTTCQAQAQTFEHRNAEKKKSLACPNCVINAGILPPFLILSCESISVFARACVISITPLVHTLIIIMAVVMMINSYNIYWQRNSNHNAQ
jgi:hypothetical protein